MELEYYKKYEPIFGEWYIKNEIGEGSYGKVVLIEKEDLGKTYSSALKLMTIPKNDSEIDMLIAQGRNPAEFYREMVMDIQHEIEIMSEFKGNSYIVSYENHKFIQHDDGIGWDILIKMELLTPLYKFISHNDFTIRDVIKLGIDICSALEICHKNNIIHRDVKPENVFYSHMGYFKLGDFGISKSADGTMSGTKIGTESYMAPEVFNYEKYGTSVDLYSLGIVMYTLLNNHRLPFEDSVKGSPVIARAMANKKRMTGEEIPEPKHATGRLAEIILRACEYDPKNRYSSAREMREDLESISYNESEAMLIYPDGDTIPNHSISTKSSKATVEITAPLMNSVDSKIDNLHAEEGTVVIPFEEQILEESEITFVEEKTMSIPLEEAESDAIFVEEGTMPIPLEEAEPDAIFVEEGTMSILLGEAEPDATFVEEGTISIPLEEAESEMPFVEEGTTMVPLAELEPPFIEEGNITIPEEETEPSESKKKKLPLIIIAAAVVIAIVVGIIIGTSESEITDITGINDKETILIGDSLSPEYGVEPEKYADSALTFEIKDEKVASVNKDGRIKAKNIGDTVLTITATGKKDVTYSKTIKITVDPKVSKISKVNDEYKLTEGNTKDLNPQLSPKKYADEKITYSIKDKKIATVSSLGKITAKKAGTTKLTIKAGGCERTITIKVTEKPKQKKVKKKKQSNPEPVQNQENNSYTPPATNNAQDPEQEPADNDDDFGFDDSENDDDFGFE